MRALPVLIALFAVWSVAADSPALALASRALPSACAAGSHVESNGACRADIVKIDRYCPAGTIYSPGRDGWTCEPFALQQ